MFPIQKKSIIMARQKICLITGAAGGIGRALCENYSCAGWHVIATSRSQNPKELNCAAYIPADGALIARDEDARLDFIAKVREHLADGKLDSLINNAAVQILGATEDITLDDFRFSFDVNVAAPFAFVQGFLKELTEANGRVVNIGTVHAQSTKAGFVAYATTKTALHGLTRALAVDLGPDIRVNTLAPAATATPMLMAGFENNPEAFQALSDAHPLKRIADPSEIAKAALFLSGSDSSFLTGSTIYADGGVLSRLHDPG